MPGRAGIGQRCATDDAGAVHLPDGRRAVAALPEQVALSVAVEVAGADQVPGRAGIGKRRTADDTGAVHLPDRRGSVVVLPQQVALPVAVEVAGADQVPGRAGIGIGQRSATDDAGAVHLPDRRGTVVVLPQQVALSVAVEVAGADQVPGRAGRLADASIVGVKLSELRLRRPRQWGACWLALMLWRELQLDQFWSTRLGMSRKGTHWDQVLFVLVAYRLLAPGSEWRLHREWFQRSALADLLGEDAGVAEIHKLYRCHDRLLVHKQAVFDHLTARWRDLFNISYDVLLYDLTSPYFEADPPFPEGDKRRFGYSRDHRPDCVQIIIALVVTPEGLPLSYEVLPGNTADKTTLRGFLERIERQYGKARRVWLMDRGVPTEEVLAEMRAADPPVHYLVGTPK